MTHARTQIRQAVIALLAGNTSAGNHVYEARVYPIAEPKLPALLVYTKQESITDKTLTYPRTQQRTLMLTVEAYVKANGNIDELADTLAKEVEEQIASNSTLNNLVKDISLDTTETQFSDQGEKPIAVAVLTFAVNYLVKENAPDVLI